ncbi:MAG: condensation domain-containing protein [Oscillospiraceae bacterium]|jgi:hypothetical protein|nr:condensation domain-containing protein [Oscillospiraceae bacterium]
MPQQLTLPQQNIRQLQQTFGPAAAWLTISAVFHQAPSVDRLREALRLTYLQTDAMRLRVTAQKGEAVQSFMPAGEIDIPAVDFRSLRAMRRWTQNLAETPLPSTPGTPLWRAYILRAQGQIGLALQCHHLIADAWGLYLLAKRVHDNLLKRDVQAGSYADFITAQQAYLNSPKRARDFAYFEGEFALCPQPVYLAEKLSPSLAAKRWSTALPRELSRQVDSAAERLGTTSYALFLCALGKAAADLRGADRLFIGTTVLNRIGRRELDTVGMFVNTVPVLIDCKPLSPESDSVSAAARIVSAQAGRLIGIFRHQRCGYTQLLADLRAKYELSGGLYDVMLNFQNIRFDTKEIGADFRWHFSGQQGETLQLHVHDWAGEGVYHLDYDYRTALLRAGDVRRLHRAAAENMRAFCLASTLPK